jgi:hypothetical protein
MGNVGIGTTDPGAYKLKVVGSLDATSIYVSGAQKNTNWDAAYNERRQWDGGSTNLVVATGRTSLGLGSLATKSTIANADVDAAAAIAGTKISPNFGSQNIVTTGSVGIGGAPSLGAQLELSKTEAASSNPRFKLTEGNRFVQILTNAPAGSWNNLVQSGDAAIIYRGATGGESGALVIGQHSNSTRGIRIDANGNVGIGIGTTSPAAKLDVAGNLRATGGIEPDWDSGWVYYARSASGLKKLTHNLNSFPRQIQWWFSPGNPGSWIGPVAWSKEDHWSNPIGVWVTLTEIKFTIWGDRDLYRAFNGTAWEDYITGYYRILLWK